MARSKAQIYVPQTGTIYPSIAAASAALGVDASNIGKAVRGARKSAGGYNFVAVTADIAPDTLRQINYAVEQSLSPRQKQRQAKRRKQGFGRLSAEERAAARSRAKAARALQGVLSETNKILEEYQKQGLAIVSTVVPELDKLQDIIGRNKRGFFNASAKNLAKFSEKEVNALIAAVQAQTNRRGFKDLDEMQKRKQSIAYQFGLGSAAELEKYADALPTLWNILDLARRTQEGGYDQSLYKAVSEVMQAGLDPETLKNTLDQMLAEHEAYIEDKDADSEIPDLDYTELTTKYASMLYEERAEEIKAEQGTEEITIDEITGGDWITLDT